MVQFWLFCREFTHFGVQLQAKIMRLCTKIEKYQVCNMHTIKSWTKLNCLNVTTVCLVRIEVKRGRALCIMFQTSNLIFQQCISHPTKQTGDTCWTISLFSGKFINQRSNFLVIMEVLFKQYYWYIVLNILVGSINATAYIHIIS